MTDKTREEKLEAAFTQFIADVAYMRRNQKIFEQHYGANNRLKKHRAQNNVDNILYQMGITDATDLKNISLTFLKEEENANNEN
jgi:hypothetical protein